MCIFPTYKVEQTLLIIYGVFMLMHRFIYSGVHIYKCVIVVPLHGKPIGTSQMSWPNSYSLPSSGYVGGGGSNVGKCLMSNLLNIF